MGEGEYISCLPVSPSPVFCALPFLCEPLRRCASASKFLALREALLEFVEFLAG